MKTNKLRKTILYISFLLLFTSCSMIELNKFTERSIRNKSLSENPLIIYNGELYSYDDFKNKHNVYEIKKSSSVIPKGSSFLRDSMHIDAFNGVILISKYGALDRQCDIFKYVLNEKEVTQKEMFSRLNAQNLYYAIIFNYLNNENKLVEVMYARMYVQPQ